MTEAESIIARARMFLFVREVGANKGRWVEAMQRIGGTSAGQPWCACFVFTVLGIWYDGKPPLAFTASCDVILEEARTKGWLHDAPKTGDLFLVMKSPTDAIHVGIVTDATDLGAGTFATIEGNTNPDGGVDGYGVFERVRKRSGAYKFVRYLP